jgi:hypothetical protein
MLVTLPGRTTQACDDDILCLATAVAHAFMRGFFAAEPDSEAETWWQNGHTCGRAECNAGSFLFPSQALLAVLPLFAAICLLQSAVGLGTAAAALLTAAWS